jgi:hypothetical protein
MVRIRVFWVTAMVYILVGMFAKTFRDVGSCGVEVSFPARNPGRAARVEMRGRCGILAPPSTSSRDQRQQTTATPSIEIPLPPSPQYT